MRRTRIRARRYPPPDEGRAHFALTGFLSSRFPPRGRHLAGRSRALLSRYHAPLAVAEPYGFPRRIGPLRFVAGRTADRRASDWAAVRRRTRAGCRRKNRGSSRPLAAAAVVAGYSEKQ